MNLLAQSAFLKALACSLLHSLWQIGILWFLYLLITGNGKKFVSRQRYNLALILTLFGSLAFLITSVNQFYQFTEPVLIFQQSNSSEFSVENNVFDLRRFALWLEPCLAYLSFIYLFAIALLFIRFYRQYYFSKKLITRGVQKANPEIRIFLQQMAGRFAIKKKIRIGLSDLVYTPLTLGFWKPVILLPVAIVNQLNIKQTEAIILHELNHIKQNDYLINLFITCLDILLFFNPFSRLLTGILLKERENCCDDMVLQFRYTPKEYAKALLILEQNRLSSIPLISISATGNNKKLLLSRVQRILEGKNSGAVTGTKMYAFLIAAIIFGGIGFFNPGTLIIQPLPSLSGNYINKDLPVNAILYSTVEKSRIKKIIPPAHNPKTDFSFKSVPIHQEPTKYSQPNSDYLVTLASEKETIAGIDNDALQKKNNLSGYVDRKSVV